MKKNLHQFSINYEEQEEPEEQKSSFYISENPPSMNDLNSTLTTVKDLFEIHKSTSMNYLESLQIIAKLL